MQFRDLAMHRVPVSGTLRSEIFGGIDQPHPELRDVHGAPNLGILHKLVNAGFCEDLLRIVGSRKFAFHTVARSTGRAKRCHVVCRHSPVSRRQDVASPCP